MTPNIYTNNLHLRPLEESDLAALTAYRAVPAVAAYQNWENFQFEDALKLLEQVNETPFGTLGRWFQLAITQRGTNHLVGDLGVHFLDHDQIEVGFTIAPKYQRQGFAAEALTFLLDHLFQELKKHRVWAVTDVRNTAARRTLEKLGFRKEAHFIETIYFKGAWGSEYLFALLHSEWKKRQPALRAGQAEGD